MVIYLCTYFIMLTDIYNIYYFLVIIITASEQQQNFKLNLEKIYEKDYLADLNGEIIVCSGNVKDRYIKNQKIILFYSTQTEDYELICKRVYKIPKDFKLISI